MRRVPGDAPGSLQHDPGAPGFAAQDVKEADRPEVHEYTVLGAAADQYRHTSMSLVGATKGERFAPSMATRSPPSVDIALDVEGEPSDHFRTAKMTGAK